jgi:hypothetical protein
VSLSESTVRPYGAGMRTNFTSPARHSGGAARRRAARLPRVADAGRCARGLASGPHSPGVRWRGDGFWHRPNSPDIGLSLRRGKVGASAESPHSSITMMPLDRFSGAGLAAGVRPWADSQRVGPAEGESLVGMRWPIRSAAGRRRGSNNAVTPSRFSRCRPCGSSRGSNDRLGIQSPPFPAFRARGAHDRRVRRSWLQSLRVPASPSMVAAAARRLPLAAPNGPAGLRGDRASNRVGNARAAPGLPPNPHPAPGHLRQQGLAGKL